MKIFIFDDNKRKIEEIADVLVSVFGYEVEFTDDGEEALNKFKNNGDYDLAVLEILTPKVSGIDICRILTERRKNTPVILISELPLYSLKFQKSLKTYPEFSVVKGVLQKPFLPEDLLLKINSVMKKE